MKKLLAVSLLLFASGCAHAQPPPIRVRLDQLRDLPKDQLAAGAAIVVEIHEGDIIPLDFSLDGEFLSSPTNQPSIPLVAKKAFWLRIDKSGLAASRDGVTFGGKPRVPGSFRVGVSANRERGLYSEIVINTPRP